MMIKQLLIVSFLCNIAFTIQCSLQEKLAQASEKIIALRQDIKTGKDLLDNKATCGGSNCCGNSCGRCGKND